MSESKSVQRRKAIQVENVNTSPDYENVKADYTPTIEEVRAEYVEYCDAPDCHKHQYAGLAFDRWLAEVKAEAWDEGWCSGDEMPMTANPYREVSK